MTDNPPQAAPGHLAVLQSLLDYHDNEAAKAEAADMPESDAWHQQRSDALKIAITALCAWFGWQARGESAPTARTQGVAGEREIAGAGLTDSERRDVAAARAILDAGHMPGLELASALLALLDRLTPGEANHG